LVFLLLSVSMCIHHDAGYPKFTPCIIFHTVTFEKPSNVVKKFICLNFSPSLPAFSKSVFWIHTVLSSYIQWIMLRLGIQKYVWPFTTGE
jgi:hypothetical protein